MTHSATTLNNLAVLQKDQNDYEKAASSYDEALRIRRELAQEYPRTYRPNVAMTVVNLSIFYLQAVPDAAKSIALAEEVIEICANFPHQTPLIQQCSALAQQVLQANNEKA